MNEDQMVNPYYDEYKNFLTEYKKGFTDGERVGEVICRMTQYFCSANEIYGRALIAYNRVASLNEQATDEATGKSISSAKATKLSESTSEYEHLINTKIDVANIEQILGALKSLQRGIMAEFSQVKNS